MSVFDSIRLKKVGRSKFNLSFSNNLTMKQGVLTPILCKEILPGDRFKLSSEHLLRFQPLLAPVYSNMKCYVHYFFVPNRILWRNWEKFISQPESVTSPVPPTLRLTQEKLILRGIDGNLGDYLGLPSIPAETSISVNALPFAAYAKIYDDYYRNESIEPSIFNDDEVFQQDGEVDENSVLEQELLKMRRRCWEKDYFTSCLPSAQQGLPVEIPVHLDGSDLEIKYKNTSTGRPTYIKDVTNELVTAGGTLTTNSSAQMRVNVDGGTPQLARLDNSENLEIRNVDGEYINTNININDLRVAERLQQWLENNIKAGTRYIEQLKAHFGVISDDARLQRPEYLGGGQQPIIVSEVTSSSATSDAELGEYAGHAVSYGESMSFNRKFKEHGFLIGVMSILPRTVYQDGLSRMWTRLDPFDYYFPEFANLGEQAVLNKEVMLRDDSDYIAGHKNDDVFGYQQRYAEYKSFPNEVHGDFRSSLAFWTQTRLFGTYNNAGAETDSPVLNHTFVEAHPSNRIFNVVGDGSDKIVVNVNHRITAWRKMPRHAYPSI